MRSRAVLASLALAVSLAGCRGMTSTQPPVHLNPSMDNQPKARAQSESDFFYDGASMRPPVPGTVARGADRYHIYCQPCHDPRGDGKGVLAQRGGVPTTSMHDPKVLNAVDGHIYNVITNGQGLMPAYRWPIPPADRWAIVAHVRQLQQQRQAEGAAQ